MKGRFNIIIKEENLKENKLTDDQVEQVSGGQYRGRAATHNILEDETEKQKSAGTRTFNQHHVPH